MIFTYTADESIIWCIYIQRLGRFGNVESVGAQYLYVKRYRVCVDGNCVPLVEVVVGLAILQIPGNCAIFPFQNCVWLSYKLAFLFQYIISMCSTISFVLLRLILALIVFTLR